MIVKEWIGKCVIRINATVNVTTQLHINNNVTHKSKYINTDAIFRMHVPKH